MVDPSVSGIDRRVEFFDLFLSYKLGFRDTDHSGHYPLKGKGLPLICYDRRSYQWGIALLWRRINFNERLTIP